MTSLIAAVAVASQDVEPRTVRIPIEASHARLANGQIVRQDQHRLKNWPEAEMWGPNPKLPLVMFDEVLYTGQV